MEPIVEEEHWEVVDSQFHIWKWHNFVRGISTLRVLRAFWSQLGAYTNVIKKRGLSN